MSKESLATRTAAWIGGLQITQGPDYGQAVNLLKWEKDFLRGVLQEGVDTAALSIARGNGKTTFLAAIAAAAVCGPLAKPGAEVTLVASSFSQARIAYQHIIGFLQERIDADRSDWRVTDSSTKAELIWKPQGTRLVARGSDPRRAHGLAPSLVLADEPAQWPANTAMAMLAALETALGKIEGAKLVALGTRPADEEHWFQKWLDGGADYVQCYAADPDDDPFNMATARKANPSLRAMPVLAKTIRRDMARAKKDAAFLQAYRALRLNLGVSDVTRAALLDAALWRELESDRPMREGPCVWGVDLGSSAAMSAVAAYWPATGWLEVLAAFPGDEDLNVRGNRDGVGSLYHEMRERGELITTAGRTVDVGELVSAALGIYGPPQSVASDRWREPELLDALEASGVPPANFTPRGMGYRDGADDVRRFRRRALDGQIATPVSLLMRSAMAGAVTVSDPAGNAKLAKHGDGGGRRQNHRDDAAAAAVVAVGEGDRMMAGEMVDGPSDYTPGGI